MPAQPASYLTHAIVEDLRSAADTWLKEETGDARKQLQEAVAHAKLAFDRDFSEDVMGRYQRYRVDLE